MLNQQVYNDFNGIKNRGRSFIVSYCKNLYNKLVNNLESVMGSAGGFFTAIRTACAIVACDGKLTVDEYNAFVEFSGSSCSYDEFYDTACGVSKDFAGAINQIRSCGSDAVGITYALAIGVFALKGYLSSSEECFIENLLY